jgi:hypothetical protein
MHARISTASVHGGAPSRTGESILSGIIFDKQGNVQPPLLQCFLESDPNEHLPDPPQLGPILAAIGIDVGDTTVAWSHNDGQNRI